jgi:formylglycine-generating enzyme required for sulfatase activity
VLAIVFLLAMSGIALAGVSPDTSDITQRTPERGTTDANPPASVVPADGGLPAAASCTLTMIPVPAGTLQRDSTSANTSTVSAFLMSQTEITRAQWKTVTGLPDPSYADFSTGANDPVQGVNWYPSPGARAAMPSATMPGTRTTPEKPPTR